jgi:hypothetical protein
MLLAAAGQSQSLPPALFANLQVKASCTWDPQTQTYSYQYLVTNPASNNLQIWTLKIHVANKYFILGDPVAPPGWHGKLSKDDYVDDPEKFPPKPYASWNTVGINVDMPNPPDPGTTSGPFGFTSTALPTITDMWISPWMDPYWDAYFQATGAQDVDLEISEGLFKSLIRRVPTLGPLSVLPGSFEHFDTLLANLAQAAQLGWISDASLLATLQSHLTAARQAALNQDAGQLHSHLQAVLDAINASTPAQRTQEAYALVFYNASFLQDFLPWPCEPKLVLSPKEAIHSLGQTHTLEATLTNVATSLPIANNSLFFEVTDGPHAGLALSAQTDQQGKASFSY